MKRARAARPNSAYHVSAATADVRPPPALTHGLTSRSMWDAMRKDVEALVPALIGSAYPDPPVVDAARSAAEAILHLHQVRRAKLSTLEQLRKMPDCLRGDGAATLKSIGRILDGDFWDENDAELQKLVDFNEGAERGEHGDAQVAEEFMASILGQNPRELRRMAEYERRALSLRQKALRRLAYERIEAERRRQRA